MGFHALFSTLRFTFRFTEAIEVTDLPCIIVGQVEQAGDGLARDALPVEFPHSLDVPRGGADAILPALEIRDRNGIWREIWRLSHRNTQELVESLYGGFYGGWSGTGSCRRGGGRRGFHCCVNFGDPDLVFDALGPVIHDQLHFLVADHDVLVAEVVGVTINSDDLGLEG